MTSIIPRSPEVIRILGISELQHTGPYKRDPEARCARRVYAVVHVGAQRGAEHDVHGVPNPHHVPWLVLGQARSALRDNPARSKTPKVKVNDSMLGEISCPGTHART